MYSIFYMNGDLYNRTGCLEVFLEDCLQLDLQGIEYYTQISGED